jgi:hypothetical protein
MNRAMIAAAMLAIAATAEASLSLAERKRPAITPEQQRNFVVQIIRQTAPLFPPLWMLRGSSDCDKH